MRTNEEGRRRQRDDEGVPYERGVQVEGEGGRRVGGEGRARGRGEGWRGAREEMSGWVRRQRGQSRTRLLATYAHYQYRNGSQYCSRTFLSILLLVMVRRLPAMVDNQAGVQHMRIRTGLPHYLRSLKNTAVLHSIYVFHQYCSAQN